MPNINPTADQLAARLSPTATNITIPTSGLYRALGDNGDAVYSFDASGTPTAYQLAQPGKAANDYGANLAALSGYGVNWASLPTFNRADIDQRLLSQGKVNSSGMAAYNSGGSLSDLANLFAKPATSTTETINNTPNTLAAGVQPGVQPARTGADSTAENGAVALPFNGGAAPVSKPPVDQTGVLAAPDYQLHPGETIAAYNARIAAANPNLPAPGTTSSTGVTNNTPISSANLTPGATPTFTTPTDTYSKTSADYLAGMSAATAAATKAAQDAATKMGPQDTALHDAVTQLMSDNTAEAGKPAAQATADTNAGVKAKKQVVDDLNTKMSNLLMEATSVQDATQPNAGVTTAIDARQRADTTNRYAVQVRSLQALINSANGQLVAAQANSKAAVDLVFAPLEAKIASEEKNINLLKNDPATTIEEKKQADAQQAIVDAQKAQLANQKTNLADVFKVATDAAAQIANFTATPQYQSASQALTAIQQAHTPGEALAIAVVTGLTGAKSGTWSDPYMLGGSYVQKNSQTGEVRQAVNPPNTPTVQPEDKAIAAFQSDASDFIAKLGSNTISWGAAWNALHAKYPQASNELIDQTLNKDAYYTVTGK